MLTWRQVDGVGLLWSSMLRVTNKFANRVIAVRYASSQTAKFVWDDGKVTVDILFLF